MPLPNAPEGRIRLDEDYQWTPRQRQVLDLITRGYTNPQIADALNVSLDGAKWHVREILSKLGVDTREEAAEYWRACNGLRVRLSRLFRAAAAPGMLRWAAVVGGVVIGGGTIALVLMVSSWSDEHGVAPPHNDPTPAIATPSATSTSPLATPSGTPSPTASGEGQPPLYPLDFRSGDPGLDSLLDIVTAAGELNVEDRVGLVPIPCEANTPYACRDSETEGTPVAMFLGAGCQRNLYRDIEPARRDTSAVLAAGPLRLYAAYQFQVTGSGPTLIAVVLSDGAGTGWRRVFLDDDAHIVGVDRFCSGTFPSFEFTDDTDYVVRPLDE